MLTVSQNTHSTNNSTLVRSTTTVWQRLRHDVTSLCYIILQNDVTLHWFALILRIILISHLVKTTGTDHITVLADSNNVLDIDICLLQNKLIDSFNNPLNVNCYDILYVFVVLYLRLYNKFIHDECFFSRICIYNWSITFVEVCW